MSVKKIVKSSTEPSKDVLWLTGGVLREYGKSGWEVLNWGSETDETQTEQIKTLQTLVKELTTKLNLVADSDDEALDQLSEIVAFIKDNKDLISELTTGKVSVSDIANNLTTLSASKVLSANQGYILSDMITSTKSEVAKNTSSISTMMGAYASLSTTFINHISNTSNPHNVTKTQVGLGNVDNTSDLNKPISTATQTALNLKADEADLSTLERDLGQYEESTPITLEVEQSGKYVANTGVVTTNSAYAISKEVSLSKGYIYLFKPSTALALGVSLCAQHVTEETPVIIDYTYTYNSDETYATATADYDTTLKYTYTYDNEGNLLYIKDKNGKIVTELPAYHTVSAGSYVPLFKNLSTTMPKSGYYVILCNEDCKAVFSAPTASINGGTVLVTSYGIFRSIINKKQDKITVGSGLKMQNNVISLDASLADIAAYGVEWNINNADSHITRIGNLALHKSLPIQSSLKGCVTQGSDIQYYLDPSDWRLKDEDTYTTFTGTFASTSTITTTDSVTLHYGDYLKFGDNFYKVKSVETTDSTITITLITTDMDYVEPTVDDSGTFTVGSNLSGYDGEVGIEQEKFYLWSEIEGDKRRVYISETVVNPDAQEIPHMIHGAYKPTILNTVPEDMGYLSTLPVNSCISVMNTETYCRGGNNDSSYDTYLNTDIFKTQLGKPRTATTRANYRTYNRNSGGETLCYDYYKAVLYWLWVIEYANFNSQETFNSELTSEGYHQGGMGAGISTLGNWDRYNNYYPIAPNGYGNAIGNSSNIKSIALPAFTTSVTSTYLNAWSNGNGATWTGNSSTHAVTITKISSLTNSIIYNTNNFSGTLSITVSGLTDGQSLIIKEGSTALQTITEDGDYSITFSAWNTTKYIYGGVTGDCNIVITQTSTAEVFEGSYNAQTLSMPRWRGFDNPFGDTWTNVDGIIIYRASDFTGSKVYTTTDPDCFGDNTDAMAKMTLVGHETESQGYIKLFDLGDKAYTIPASVGGNSTTYKCDYHWTNASVGCFALLLGGKANNGASAGLAFWASGNGVGGTDGNVAARRVISTIK